MASLEDTNRDDELSEFSLSLSLILHIIDADKNGIEDFCFRGKENQFEREKTVIVSFLQIKHNA